jgi:hypothetical protein
MNGPPEEFIDRSEEDVACRRTNLWMAQRLLGGCGAFWGAAGCLKRI